ncbi:MAG: alpha-L-glutamate ligase-like protein [Succinivibrionaceae bacterium]
MFGFLKKYASPFKMARIGIMGMNVRNCRYISPYNPRNLYPLVDDKLQTKKIALKYGVTVPNLIGCIQHQYQVSDFPKLIGDRSEFCIKPAQGSGGKGILVIVGRRGDKYVKPNKQEISALDVERHISNILAGLFSLGGKLDKALIEDLIHFDNVFDGYSYEGVPDSRVIVFKGFPVMSMMRLSTARSDGKANLHQGAVGVGLCINTGRAIRAVQFNTPVHEHPDTGKDLYKLQVPQWDKVLRLAASCYEMSGLGYIGTDIVLDRDKGPMLLELNARPGLAIQIANASGLLPRLRLIEKLLEDDPRMTVDERIAFSKKHFGIYS